MLSSGRTGWISRGCPHGFHGMANPFGKELVLQLLRSLSQLLQVAIDVVSMILFMTWGNCFSSEDC